VNPLAVSELVGFLAITMSCLPNSVSNLAALVHLGISLFFYIRAAIHHRRYGTTDKTQRKSREKLRGGTLPDALSGSGELIAKKIATSKCREYYMGKWWLSPSSGHGESNESKDACGLS
jgi:hypothetical protein